MVNQPKNQGWYDNQRYRRIQSEIGGKLPVFKMKADTLQILWHPDKSNKGQAVYALDINQANVLATAGADEMVRVRLIARHRVVDTAACLQLWQINGDKVEFITELSGHDRTVNVVRFSPDGN